MSDVGDVNKAHMKQPEDPLELYVHAARRMLNPSATMVDRMAFSTFHSATNVAKLGDRIDALRAENTALLEAMFPDEDD